MVLNTTYTEALNDTFSQEYQALAAQVSETMLDIIRKQFPNAVSVQVVGFKKGSVIAIIRVVIDNQIVEYAVQANGIATVITTAIVEGNISTALNTNVDKQEPLVSGMVILHVVFF